MQFLENSVQKEHFLVQKQCFLGKKCTSANLRAAKKIFFITYYVVVVCFLSILSTLRKIHLPGNRGWSQ